MRCGVDRNSEIQESFEDFLSVFLNSPNSIVVYLNFSAVVYPNIRLVFPFDIHLSYIGGLLVEDFVKEVSEGLVDAGESTESLDTVGIDTVFADFENDLVGDRLYTLSGSHVAMTYVDRDDGWLCKTQLA